MREGLQARIDEANKSVPAASNTTTRRRAVKINSFCGVAMRFGFLLRQACAVLFLLSTCAWAPASLAANHTILVFGDSLSAAYGLSSGQGWVDLLQHRLAEQRLPWQVANASISGETTAGGRTRIDAALKQFAPAVVVLELGANDGLRGGSIALMRENLEYMITRIRSAEAQVVIIGMRLPPNYGADYTRQFFESYALLAKKYRASYVPFLMEGLSDDGGAFQEDRLHPTAQAQPTLLDTVWRVLAPVLKGPR
jgi:acyl-CoA thioesterase-1